MGSFRTHHQSGTGELRTTYFDQKSTPRELPNIAALTWSRSADPDAATCTITPWNTEPLPVGAVPDTDYALGWDQPGYYTYNRGTDGMDTAFGAVSNGWADWIVPDRVVRTYEGYGFDSTATPDNDVNMYPSGMWLIDDVPTPAPHRHGDRDRHRDREFWTCRTGRSVPDCPGAAYAQRGAASCLPPRVLTAGTATRHGLASVKAWPLLGERPPSGAHRALSSGRHADPGQLGKTTRPITPRM